MLDAFSAQPSRFAAIAGAAAGRLPQLDGGGLASMMATAALLGDFGATRELAAFWAAALDEDALRSRVFSPQDQALLYHVHVAATGAGAPGLPRDIADHCERECRAQEAALQGLYDVLALALRRLHVPYTYKLRVPVRGTQRRRRP
jgi:hypothetical protein